MPGVTRILPHPPASSFVPSNSVEPGDLMSGTPDENVSRHFASSDGKTTCGVWTCGAYTERIPSFPVNELFVVIEGTLVLTVDGSEPETFTSGDMFTIEQGTACTLDFRSPFRKIYMNYKQDPAGSG